MSWDPDVVPLNQSNKLIPNKSILLETIPILEAQSSSEIENIYTTTVNMFKHVDSMNMLIRPLKKPYATKMLFGPVYRV